MSFFCYTYTGPNGPISKEMDEESLRGALEYTDLMHQVWYDDCTDDMDLSYLTDGSDESVMAHMAEYGWRQARCLDRWSTIWARE